MNWIIKKSDKLQFHTNLSEVINPIVHETRNFNWLVSDLDFIAYEESTMPINLTEDYSILSAKEFAELLSKRVQVIWGAVLGFPDHVEINFANRDLPYVEGNDNIWEAGVYSA